ncbi:sigma-54 interaction domain-containing protein [Clostridium sp. MT-14]|mgnify:CR=1 FL=1|uniref:Sigma 54-interacting transcriptional regulator n=1 Tax=Clostridium aromativorans TaxID=2836848 RepID=A0ABS8N8W5_9CLOT|nr:MULTISPECIES: sigma 54-interacting transcriptional regulator [Clostridium]KAA8668778.1 AAA domain-containing protein [Clostridium sp. HV4-5-A1G]MCC9295158.1 sigma 54-interacting transcriptional regulator [Clostridium aromativorans]CAB1248111.1 Transcriptional regulator [Clostridiaceae bacterium BL-3]
MIEQIKNDLQDIAETIKAVIDIDITIMDRRLLRVAGTGRLKKKIGLSAPKNSVFEKCLKSGKSYFIENPGGCTECIICETKTQCDEKAEVCFPIIIDGRAEGIIAMIIFDEDKKEMFLKKRDSYKNFDRRMGELISFRIKEKNMHHKLEYKSTELLTIIDSVNEGIITIDSNNRILNLNRYIKEKFKLKETYLINKDVSRIIPEKIVNKFQPNNYYIEEETVTVDFNKSRFNFLLSVRPINFDKGIYGAVITFKDFNKLQQSVFKMDGKNSMFRFKDIIGSSDVFVQVKDQVKQVAKKDMPVLLLGESGTGKELFARAIHYESYRKNEVFMPINCGAIPETLMESELFGYEKGAFTGASNSGKMGKFEIAKDGTIFLDEIGDLPLHMQVKLLRALEEKEIVRIGGISTIKVNPRIIAATNKDLYGMVEKGQFREDLFYRLNVIPIRIPALRQRGNDILELSQYFLDRYNNIYDKNIRDFSEKVKEMFLEYSWPGNVRELQNLIEYAINFEKGSIITSETIRRRTGKFNDRVVENESLRDMVLKYERGIINSFIEKYGSDTDSKKLIAKKLKISTATLYRKIGDEKYQK